MGTRGRSGMDGRTTGREDIAFAHFSHFTHFKLAPVARAFAFTLAAGGMIGSAHAVQPFSPAWFANKGAIQATAAATGLMPNGTPVSSLNPQAQQQAANTQLQQSIANLGQAARGIAWLQGIQAAQRQTALGNPSSIPDGLGAGGLDTGSLASSWVNASAPTQSTDANGKTVVDIQQTADKAIANWQTFNVGKNTIVQFDQASADWAILNRITDPAMAPSQIQGQIRAPGTVLIVNQNGIVFSGSSQVNTRNLVAAAANITDLQFQTNGIYGPDQSTPSFTNAQGNLIVQAGAQITTNAPSSVTQGGGYVLLMGQQVNNYGDIETPRGQIELAAGDNFVIRQGVGTDGNTFSTTRGNEIAPLLNPGSTSGQVINETGTGLLLATEGDITLAGHDVQQNGVAVATTTVNTRGTIHLLNSASDTTGSVTLGDGAITAVAIEDDGSTALNSQRSALIDASGAQDVLRASAASGLFDNLSALADLEDESRIEIVTGGSVNFDGNSLTLATGGQIAVSAVNRTFVADGAILDVSGQVGVNLAMSSNDVVVNVQGNELRDSPENRDSGSLFNSNITVDRRDLIEVPAGTGGDPDERWYTTNGLLEVSGYLNNQGHTIGEWAAQGGTIQLSGNEVVTQTGSQINLSGGSLNVATGYVAQTWLVGSDGQLYNANNAPADMTFTGIYKGFEVAHARWGADAAEFFYNPLIAPQKRLENGYTVGRDAGQLIVNASTAVMEGDILATVYNGPLQDRVRDDVADNYLQAQTAVAKPGSVSFGQYGPGGLDGVNDTDIQIGNVTDVTGGMADDAALSTDRIGTTWLDAGRLNAEGLSELDLATQGNAAINAPLTLADGGALNITAPTADINADITVRGGDVTIGNILHQPGNNVAVLTTPAGLAGVTLEAGVQIDTRGLWTNALIAPDELAGLPYVNGGAVAIVSTQDIVLSAGSIIDTSSGAAILTGGKTMGGAGGAISLIADAPANGAVSGGNLFLGGSLSGLGVNSGGALTLESASVLIGDNVTAGVPGQLVLPTAFFAQGFSSYNIVGTNGVSVAPGAQVNVIEPVYQFTAASDAIATGADPGSALQVWTPPVYFGNSATAQVTQRAGASLSLQGNTIFGGGGIGPVTIGAGASIAVDPGQAINISSWDQITVDGALHAPGGTISILGAGVDNSATGQSIWIGGDATLDVSAQRFTATDLQGRPYGTETAGGSIVLGLAGDVFDTENGLINSAYDFILVGAGALLDASGTSISIDPAAGTGGTGLIASTDPKALAIASDGGSITLSSYSGIYIDGTMRAASGGAGAAGGSLTVTLETPPFQASGGPSYVPRVITFSQAALAPQLAAGLQPGVNDPTLQFGQAQLSADAIAAGGFGALSFTARDAILFNGDVNLTAGQSIAFHEGAIADTSATGRVTISAPYVLLDGQTSLQDDLLNFYPTLWGVNENWLPSTQQSTGVFAVNADLIDIADELRFGIDSPATGNNTGTPITYDYAGFGNVNLTSQGDVRFLPPTPTIGANAGASNSSLATSGDLNFTAAQLYPVTGAVAVIAAGVLGSGLDPNSVIDINRISGVDPAAPYSVQGSISFAAGTINQDGVVRAPLGQITFGGGFNFNSGATGVVNLLPDSLSSTSLNGQTVLYGGTADGIVWTIDGVALTSALLLQNNVVLDGLAFNIAKGAVIDLSGGGDLAGAGFVSGRGGSVDVLATALVNANPSNSFSSAGDQVFAIVPGYQSGYTPVDPAAGAAPGIGRQITVAAGVPGLAAGVYTLLPARYALLPGGYRVELGKTVASRANVSGAVAAGNGSYVIDGFQGVANTGIENVLATQLIVTPGSAVRNDSQYNETTYAAFATQQAATLEQFAPQLPVNAGTLSLNYQGVPDATQPALTFDGTALFQAGTGGQPGSAIVNVGDVEIYAGAPTAGFAGVSLNVADLDAIGASSLQIGGNGSVTLRNGADLKAPQILLVSGLGLFGAGIILDPGAEIDTIGMGAAPVINGALSASGNAELAVSNGVVALVYLPAADSLATITIGDGAKLYSEGSIGFSAGGAVTIADTAVFGTANLGFSAGNINIGDAAGMAGAVVPAGLNMTQARLNALLAGDTNVGAPALQTLTLSASQALNVFGSVNLDIVDPKTGKADLNLVLDTPAIYGYGAADDTATLTTGTLTWSGIAATGSTGLISSAPPGPIVANGPGTGAGTLDLVANQITFGFDPAFAPDNQTTYDRVVYGFSTVNLIAPEITSNNKNTLSVYQSQGATPGGPGVGGNLNLDTSLLTGAAASILSVTAGGALTIAPPSGSAPGVAGAGALGGEIDLAGASIDVASTILLPTGKLTLAADGNIALQAGAILDLSGQPTTLVDQTEYSAGGDVILLSTNGNITQAAGATIDVSAVDNNAGTIEAQAVGSAGQVALNGTLLGASTLSDGASAHYNGGAITVDAQTLASATAAGLSTDFAALNTALTAGGFSYARSFDLKQGDLAIGGELQAHTINVSLDNGSLTVNGTIDASGAGPGAINLAAMNGLTLSGSAVLDAHGTMLRVDSYGNPIDAENTGVVQLTATHGMLTLSPGATIDVSAPDGVARGQITLNASRTGETSGDIHIDAAGPLTIKGAQSIALNGFWTYAPADQYGTIVQDNGTPLTPGAVMPTTNAQGYLGLAQIDNNSQMFINAALADTGLLNRMTGLTAYSNAFHLHPGVEIDGTPSAANPNGTLTVAGDIDLSGFRYASLNPNFQRTGVYGSGEPGALVIRAGGDLDVVGSISDGFLPVSATTTDDNGWVIQTGLQTNSIETLLPLTLNAGTTFPNTAGLTLRYDIPIESATLKANIRIPAQVTLSSDYTVPAGTRLTGAVFDSGGNLLYPAGTVMASATTLPAGSQLAAGSVMPNQIDIAAVTWPAGAALGDFTDSVSLASNVVVPFEGMIPAGTNVLMSSTTANTRPTGTNGNEGSILTVAALLPAGDLSWSIALVAGADLGAADPHIVEPASLLQSLGVSGNITLSDAHHSVTPGSTTTTTTKRYYYYYHDPYSGITNKDPTYGSQAYACTHFGNTACVVAYHTQTITRPTKINGLDSSVVRTGTGDLSLIAGGSFNEDTLYGVYTAGAQSPAVGADVANPLAGMTNPVTGIVQPAQVNEFDLPRGLAIDGSNTTVLGTSGSGNEATTEGYQAWYPAGGGNLTVSVQGGLNGYSLVSNPNTAAPDSDLVSNWLWRQGGAIVGQASAWWINYGAYVPICGFGSCSPAVLTGFAGIGTLGGGNVTIDVGGDASGLTAAVGSTGRVLADGTLVETGGGALTVKVGGVLNGNSNTSFPQGQSGGSFADVRGDIAINAGAIGDIAPKYGTSFGFGADPRNLNALTTAENSDIKGGIVVVPGDGTVTLATRGDLVLDGVGDPGLGAQQNPSAFTGIVDGVATNFVGGGGSWFSLWTPATAINLFSAGGNLAPNTQFQEQVQNDRSNGGGTFIYPSTLNAVAASGSIYFVESVFSSISAPLVELAPAPQGQLNLLAEGSIYGAGVAMSGADPSIIATPFNPAFTFSERDPVTGTFTTISNLSPSTSGPFAFGADTPTTNLHADDPNPIRIYAATGDIVGLELGAVINWDSTMTPSTWYIGAKPADIVAARSIVDTGASVPSQGSSGAGESQTYGFILNDNPSDVSVIQAGRDIFFTSMQIGGPGLLEVQAGGNLYQANQGTFNSLGLAFDVNQGNRNAGAGITVMAGVGAAGPDYTDFAKLYFNAANQANVAIADTDPANAGKVPVTYADQLYAWLQQRFGYTGSETDALAYFLALPNQQQGVFVRQVYFDELNQSGLEFNDSSSKRFQSYLRGRDAIAALFPSVDAQGNAMDYQGDITLFGNSGIHTDFGGTIQTLTPGGQTLVGVEGANPPGTAGVVTQGSGDIDMYSLGSILLGQSRVMTTFGGDIVAWSATGDINAGRGSKTTQVFTPPRLVYDDLGDVTLSPDVPSAGAGFATLDPIPEVAPGDMNLIAPLGTIDAGEAGIRVSGNVNLAALQVVNAANIEVQGKATGIPLVAAVNVGALTNASAAASQAEMAAQDVVQRERNAARQALPSIFTVRVLGFGNDPASGAENAPAPQSKAETGTGTGAQGGYDTQNPVQVLGHGAQLDPDVLSMLSDAERRKLQQDR
jgi:filamentous hemagglutinin family protein